MGTAAKISIAIEAQTATLKKGFDDAKGAINSLAAGMSGSVAAGMAKFHVALAAVQGVLGTVRGAIESVSQAMDRMGEEVDVSDRLGMTADSLEVLRYAAEQTGAGADTITSAIEKMKNAVSEAAQGTGSGEKAIRELGLSVSELQAMSPDEQFAAFADALQGVASEGDRTRLIMDVFGKSGGELKNIIMGGSEGLNEFGKQAEAMGLLLGDARGEVDAAGDAIASMKAAWSAMWDQVAIAAAPILKWIAETITGITSAINHLLGRATGAMGKAKEYADIKTKVSIADPAAEKAAKEAEDKAAKAMEDMKSRAQAVTEAVRTPMEIYRDKMAELNELVKRGAISWQTYNRAAAAALKDVVDTQKAVKDFETPGVGAVTRGSVAGFSAIQEQQRQRADEERRHREQMQVQERIARAVERSGDLVLSPVNI